MRIGKEIVEFVGGWKTASHRPRGIRHEDENRLYELEQLQHGDIVYWEKEGAAATIRKVDGIIERGGASLTRAFLEGEAGKALCRAVSEAVSLGASLRLYLDVSDRELFNLPWETLRIPGRNREEGGALILHPNVLLCRSQPGGDSAPGIRIPGPLRILVAIGSPEEQNERGELLNMERETARILDSMERARGRGKAYVRVLEIGSVRAIREALNQERYHILHISCHAAPGVLILEDDEGKGDLVSTRRFCEEAFPPDRGVPLVVLAVCSTGIEGGKSEEESLSAVGRGLIENGAPAVVAMQAPVTDLYAIEFCGALYDNLAANENPDALTAIFEARRGVENLRHETIDPQEKIAMAGWATPTLFLRGKPLPLYDPKEPYERIEPPSVLLLDGVCVRKVGEFVGRRMDQRVLSRELREDKHAGVVIHGIGGVGKSSLAAQVLERLHRDGWFLVSLTGEVSVQSIL
ncbi:MAG: CHAT domain-containing protein, partial [Desulfobacterales bacterium]|nr:CHAT domain-containing protein [Desulfobacterales bacterium]